MKPLARMSNLMDNHGFHFDRRLRPITMAEWVRLSGNAGYKVIRQAYVVDRLPPYVALKVSTVWIGLNVAPPGAAPQVFETMTFAASPSAVDTQLDHLVHRSSSECHALDVHRDIVEAVTALMGDPASVPARRGGKRADAKPWSGMTARMRREVHDFIPESNGARRVRGRGGKPDRDVTWTWRPEARLYHVERRSDPSLNAAPGKPPRSQRRRRRR